MNQNHKDAETALGLLRVLQLYDSRGAVDGALADDVSLVCSALRVARQEGRAAKEVECASLPAHGCVEHDFGPVFCWNCGADSPAKDEPGATEPTTRDSH